jgi:hypothetical protein
MTAGGLAITCNTVAPARVTTLVSTAETNPIKAGLRRSGPARHAPASSTIDSAMTLGERVMTISS